MTSTQIIPRAINIPCENCAKDPGEPCGHLPDGRDGFCLSRLLGVACYGAAELQRIGDAR